MLCLMANWALPRPTLHPTGALCGCPCAVTPPAPEAAWSLACQLYPGPPAHPPPIEVLGHARYSRDGMGGSSGGQGSQMQGTAWHQGGTAVVGQGQPIPLPEKGRGGLTLHLEPPHGPHGPRLHTGLAQNLQHSLWGQSVRPGHGSLL